MNKKSLLCASLMLLAAAPAFAGFQAEHLTATDAIKLDGVPDEAVWQRAVAFDRFFEGMPQEKIPAKYRTDVKVAYDSRYLYVAITAFDPHPELIRAPFTRRDKVSGDQDFVVVWLDPSGTNKSAQFVYVNARGIISDGTFTNKDGGDYAPDFDVDAATARFAGGWTTELRIPFSSIAYQAGDPTAWNMLVGRSITRDERYKIFSAPVDKSTACLLCFSAPIEKMHELPSGLTWSATPQLVLGRARQRTDGQPEQTTSTHDLSLDVKIKPDSATTIDATINPDFSQVELDAPQLSGNTRFGLYVPEKRPFFLEGNDIFAMPFRAISTRSMTDPAWGARYTRRDGNVDVTVLSVRDAGGGVVMLPKSYSTDIASQDFSSQATVARVNHKSGTLAYGGMVSDRTLADGRGYNRVLGADFGYQPRNNERLTGQLLLSSTTAQPDADGRLQAGPRTDGGAGQLAYHNEGERWIVDSELEAVSADFRDDNGFMPQAGYKMWMTEVNRKLGQVGPLDMFNVFFHGEQKFDSDGKVIYNDFTPGFVAHGPRDTQINVLLRPWNSKRVTEGGELFHQRNVIATINTVPGSQFAQLIGMLELGDEIDVEGARLGKGGVASLYLRLRPHDRVEIEPRYDATWVNGSSGAVDGKRLYTEQALQVNGIVHFSPHDSLRVIVQEKRTTRDPALYAQPVAARSSGSTVSLVYGHVARLGTAAYAGITVSNGETPGFYPRKRQDELFVKLSWQI